MLKERRALAIFLRPEWVQSLIWHWKALLCQRRHDGVDGGRSGAVLLPDLTAARLPTGERIAIPRDAMPNGVRFDAERNGFCLVLEHPSFPLWEDGAYCPVASLTEVTVQALPAQQVADDAPILVQNPEV